MSVSFALRASARSAYRDLLRASGATFTGDDRVLKAFRLKMRDKTALLQSETNPAAYKETVDLIRQISLILRRNVAQAVRVQDSAGSTEGQETWRIKLTEDTEFGVNEATKESLLSNPCCPDRPEPEKSPRF